MTYANFRLVVNTMVNNKVVIVDDESAIRRMLRIALKSEGYDVYEAENGQEALTHVARIQPGLVILDLGLPDMDGQQVLAEVRNWSDVPIIILSVRDGDRDKIIALDSGAQDYVTKPFSVEELLARVRATLRDHSKISSSSMLDDGYLLFDFSKRLLSIAGEKVDVTPKEYAVLSRLAQSPNCVITQTQLLEEIWGPGHKQDSHYLRIIISHLRQKLGDDPGNPRYIRTEAGVGYRFIWTT